MALITCPKCGHRISSYARFCPKCPPLASAPGVAAPQVKGPAVLAGARPGSVANGNVPNCKELHQHTFKPSLDEKIVLEGSTFLVRGRFDILDGYAYLTSKRYALCDAGGVNILFQTAGNGIVSVEERRHLISKKIIITTASGDEIQIKGQPHAAWYDALRASKGFSEASKKEKSAPAGVSSGTLDWHYEADGVTVGPVKEDIVVQFIRNNHTIFRNTKVWNACLPEWKRADETILTIYFNDTGPAGADPTSTVQAPSRISRLFLLPQIKMLFRKYF